jgi:hypothetical protein
MLCRKMSQRHAEYPEASMAHRVPYAVDFEEISPALQSRFTGSLSRVAGNPDLRRERFRQHREFVRSASRESLQHSQMTAKGHDEEG